MSDPVEKLKRETEQLSIDCRKQMEAAHKMQELIDSLNLRPEQVAGLAFALMCDLVHRGFIDISKEPKSFTDQGIGAALKAALGIVTGKH